MRIFLAVILLVMILVSHVYAQDTEKMMTELLPGASGGGMSAGSLIGGFSLWGLAWSFLFGMVGFVAFVYGKKMAAFKPMFIGLGLMVYPYFMHGTIMIFAVGVILTALLYFLRD